jgi:hypothetical protein
VKSNVGWVMEVSLQMATGNLMAPLYMEKYAVQNIILRRRFRGHEFTNLLIYMNFIPYKPKEFVNIPSIYSASR